MKTKYYSFFDFLKLQWNNPLWTCLPDYAIKYSFFATEKEAFTAGQQPVTITVNSSPPPEEMTKGLALTSERFYGGKDFFRVDHQLGTRRWSSWVAGLFTQHVRIWYHFPWYNRTKPISWLSSDLLICFHVIQPVLEYKLQELGVVTLYAAGAVKDNRAVLMCGRGGTRKTTLLMRLVKNGWQYLADDLIFLKDGKLYPNPQSPTMFDYLLLNREDEHYRLSEYPKLLLHLLRNREISYPVAEPSEVGEVAFLLKNSVAHEVNNAKTAQVNDEVISKILSVNRLERFSGVDYDDALGRFMLHLNQVEGLNTWDNFWQRQQEIMQANISGLPYKEIAIGPKVTEEIVDIFEEMAAASS